MKRKIFTGLATMVIAFTLMVTPAFAAVVDFPIETGSFYAETDSFIVKLQETDVTAETVGTITTISVTFDQETDLLKPQLVLNSEKGGWNQVDLEFTTVGVYTYDLAANGKLTSDSGWNELWIKPGYKNEGAASIVSVEFKDADGNVVYALGDVAVVEDDVVEVEEEAVEEEAVEEVAAEATEEAVPETGVVGLGFLYGLGALATGAVLLKRKEK